MITTVFYGLTICLIIVFCLNIMNISIQKISTFLEQSAKIKLLCAWLCIGICLEMALLVWYTSLFVFLNLQTLQFILIPTCIMMVLSIISLFTEKTVFFLENPTRAKATFFWLRSNLLYLFFGTWLYMFFILYFMQSDNLAYILESRKLICTVFFAASMLIVLRLTDIWNPLQAFRWRYTRSLPV